MSQFDSILSQFDSILRVNMTRHWESIWLDIESQFYSIFRFNFTRYWESIWLVIIESIWLDIKSQIDWNILQLLGIPSRILVLPVTQLFRLKWLQFFFQCMKTQNMPSSKQTLCKRRKVGKLQQLLDFFA